MAQRPPRHVRTSLRLAATGPGTWLLARVLPPVDRLARRLSGGSVSVAELMAASGAPVARLATTGRRSGERREVPVLAVRDGDRWLVAASNWGRETHPAWYHNLRADPAVELTRGGETTPCVARVATGEERERCRERLLAANPGLPAYEERAGERTIPVVVLEPRDVGD